MNEMRELEAFEGSVLADEELRTLLQDVTRHEVAEAPSPTRLEPVSGLWLVGVAGLWLLVKVGVHHLRGMSDTRILEKQVEAVAKLKALGFEEKPAAQVVERLLKGIRARPNDDALLSKLRKLLPSS